MPLAHEWAVTFGRLAANHLWQSTGFAAVAVVLALALRANSARVRYWLWLAASVKFLIPFSVLAALGGGLGRWLVSARPVARVPLAIAEIVQPFAPLQGAGAPAAVSVPAPAASGVLPVVLLAIWFGGLAAVLLCWWVRWRRVAAAVRSSTPLREGREVEALWRVLSSVHARATTFNPEGVTDSSPRREPWETEGACAAPAGAEDGSAGGPVSHAQAGSFAPDGAGMRLARPMAYAMGYFLTPLRGWLKRLAGMWPAIRLVSSTARLEPGIFGIFRPVLWLPAGIGDRLGDAELEAILAHELCHARRRDNLAAVIHMAVEAVFWFHPLVWWLGARLTEERERACDEEVVRMGGEPQVYAQSILKVCEFYLASPVACAAGVTGGELKRRIEGIMANRYLRSLSLGKKILLAVAGLMAVGAPIVVGVMASPPSHARSRVLTAAAPVTAPLLAPAASPPIPQLPQPQAPQTPAAVTAPKQSAPATEPLADTHPAFEVASVKPAPPDARGWRCTGGPGTSDPGSLRCENYSLSLLLMMAYNLHSFQLTAPAWMDTARFNVMAKIPSGTDSRQFELMQQGLLAERFGLQVHFERKDMTVYELTVAKGGPKLKESQERGSEKPDLAWRPPAGGPPRRAMARTDRRGESIADLANFLSNQMGAPVVDATGLRGQYDYTLSFLMEPGGRAAGPVVANGSEPELGINLIDAVRDQLGLRLEKKKGQADILVVDHAEKVPTEN